MRKGIEYEFKKPINDSLYCGFNISLRTFGDNCSKQSFDPFKNIDGDLVCYRADCRLSIDKKVFRDEKVN